METVTINKDHLHFTLARINDLHSLLKFSGVSKSEQFQDLFVLSELGFKRGGFFCEFGGLDGITGSNTYLLESLFGWNGIIAEPNPEQYTNLVRNRNCNISNMAVLGTSGLEVEFLISPTAGLSGVVEFNLDDAHKDLRIRDSRIVLVRSISLNELLDKFNAPKLIDYISIDTEGSELDILKSFDFDKYLVKIFTVEHNHSVNRQPIAEFMQSKGFQIKYPFLSGGEFYFVNTNLIS